MNCNFYKKIAFKALLLQQIVHMILLQKLLSTNFHFSQKYNFFIRMNYFGLIFI